MGCLCSKKAATGTPQLEDTITNPVADSGNVDAAPEEAPGARDTADGSEDEYADCKSERFTDPGSFAGSVSSRFADPVATRGGASERQPAADGGKAEANGGEGSGGAGNNGSGSVGGGGSDGSGGDNVALRGTFVVPAGTKAYKFVKVSGSMVVAGADATIDVQTSAGVTIVDTRSFTTAWQPRNAAADGPAAGGDGGDGGRVCRIALDDARFGALKRTEVSEVVFDPAADTIQIRAAWKGRWMGMNLNVPVAVLLKRQVATS